MALSTETNITLQAAREKWLSRWPEWEIAELFLPANTRPLAWVWFAWLDELSLAAWSGTDAAPGMAKLAWWQEELKGWAKGARRHPLGATLQPLPVDWAAIAQQMGALKERDLGTTGNIAELVRAVEGFAALIAQSEQALFGGRSAPSNARVIRTLLISVGIVPDQGLGSEPSLGAAARRVLDALADLRARSAGRAVGRFQVLLASWRAARKG